MSENVPVARFPRDPASAAAEVKSLLPHQKGENPIRILSFLMPHLRRGRIRFAQIQREGHTLPSRALPMRTWNLVRILIAPLRKSNGHPDRGGRSFCIERRLRQTGSQSCKEYLSRKINNRVEKKTKFMYHLEK